MNTSDLVWLLPAFGTFVVLMIALVIFIRKRSVDDVHIRNAPPLAGGQQIRRSKPIRMPTAVRQTQARKLP